MPRTAVLLLLLALLLPACGPRPAPSPEAGDQPEPVLSQEAPTAFEDESTTTLPAASPAGRPQITKAEKDLAGLPATAPSAPPAGGVPGPGSYGIAAGGAGGPGYAPPTRVAVQERNEEFRSRRTEFNTEGYAHTPENPFFRVADEPLSTFSVDVDTASYSNVRRFLSQGSLPPAGAVRTEELLNYFTYDYPQPDGADPFSVSLEVGSCPWNAKHRLALVGLQGRRSDESRVPPRNLVFLIDVSGSMDQPDKLPLLKTGLRHLVDGLREEDRVAMVVYAGSSGLVLPSTADRAAAREALDRLEAGGSTNGAEGIQLAYRVAAESFRQGGVNRVILCTDGDFNVGVTSDSELVRLIEKKRKTGVFLTVLGFGTGNLQDSKMEQLADHGNGNYAYIDSEAEARRVLVEQAGGTLVTIAKDVKLQVEFNPAEAAEYRLVGYENRVLENRDFNDDKKDAGEIGAGHAVTALYEIVPAHQGPPDGSPEVDPLKYQSRRHSSAALTGELFTVKLRYKQPDGATSKLLSRTVRDRGARLEDSSENLRFAAAVASFAMLLRDSGHKANLTWDNVLTLATGARGQDPRGYRAEFLRLVEQARSLSAGGGRQAG